MNYISLCIDHIKEKYRPENKLQAGNFETLISSIKLEIQQARQAGQRFPGLRKPLKLNLQRVNIHQLLVDVAEIVKIKANSDKVTIQEHYTFLPYLMLDVELMKTCIFNIIINAFQAMPDGGTLCMRADNENGSFILHVSDTGSGISKEALSKVFEPFFTTKINGLGLGLAITRRVIEEHGGEK